MPHPDGQTGAIAVALAAAWMLKEGQGTTPVGQAMLQFVLGRLPRTETYYKLARALEIRLEMSPLTAASALGNGLQVIASDTVPFCLWCAARHSNDYREAIWSTVSVYGDIDTNCAIVGGIVALSAGRRSIPQEWLSARESFTV
jgi:ADP-ribosylglycohydrolase